MRKTARTMRRISSPFVVFLVLIIGACLPEERPIAPGVYSAPSGEEYLTVGPSTIRLHITARAVKSIAGQMIDGEYRYGVETGGEIHLSMHSNNFDPIEFDYYEWYWRDGRILRVERETRTETWFTAT